VDMYCINCGQIVYKNYQKKKFIVYQQKQHNLSTTLSS
jgi:hypothetical protein